MTPQTLQYSEVAPNTLRPNPWNPNHVGPDNELKLENSLKKFGFTKPLVVRTLPGGALEILGGEHRWRAAKKLGYKQVPVVNLGKIDDKLAKEICLIDNGRYGEDDTLQLSALIKEIGDLAELQSFLPYSDDELSNIFSSSSIDLDELDIPDDHGIDTSLPEVKTTQTHQLMRFKIPVEDADRFTRLIEQTMKTQNYTEEDALTNAGNALVFLLTHKG